MRIRTSLLVLLAMALPLCGCEMLDRTPPEQRPSVIAEKYVGKPLLDLEMRWSVPSDLGNAGEGKKATWKFDQFNLAGCSVTVHADARGIIRRVDWTRGCGPKGTGSEAPAGYDSP